MSGDLRVFWSYSCLGLSTRKLERKASICGGRIILLLGVFEGEKVGDGRGEGNAVVFILSVLCLEYIL